MKPSRDFRCIAKLPVDIRGGAFDRVGQGGSGAAAPERIAASEQVFREEAVDGGGDGGLVVGAISLGLRHVPRVSQANGVDGGQRDDRDQQPGNRRNRVPVPGDELIDPIGCRIWACLQRRPVHEVVEIPDQRVDAPIPPRRVAVHCGQAQHVEVGPLPRFHERDRLGCAGHSRHLVSRRRRWRGLGVE
jgi:hypothetical protein